MRVSVPFSYAAKFRIEGEKKHGAVGSVEMVDFPEVAAEDAPVALEVPESETTYRAFGGNLYVRHETPEGLSGWDELRRIVDGDATFGKMWATVRDTDRGLVVHDDDGSRARTTADIRSRFVLVGDDLDLWTRVDWEPVMHVRVVRDGERIVATGRVDGSRGLNLDTLQFSLRDVGFVGEALRATYPDRHLTVALQDVRVPMPSAMRRPCEDIALVSAAHLYLAELKVALADKSENHILAYVRLRAACATVGTGSGSTTADDAGNRVAESLAAAMRIFPPPRQVAAKVASARARWEAFLAYRAREADREEEEAVTLAGFAP